MLALRFNPWAGLPMDLELDLERERERRRRGYRFCWIGFSLYALYLIAGCFVEVSTLLLSFANLIPDLGYWLGIKSFDFWFDSVRTWGRLLACGALAAAWPMEAGWRRRSGLLLLLAAGDVVLWMILRSVPLGLTDEPTRHAVFFRSLMTALGWSRFLLVIHLAYDFARSAGMRGIEEFGRVASGDGRVHGMAVWTLFFLSGMNWERPWPPGHETAEPRRRSRLMMVSLMINLLYLLQTSLLTLQASRGGVRALRQRMAEEDRASDPWSSTSARTDPALRSGGLGSGAIPADPAALGDAGARRTISLRPR